LLPMGQVPIGSTVTLRVPDGPTNCAQTEELNSNVITTDFSFMFIPQ
jgi:hypothetical protein